MSYRLRSPVEATQWIKNGDHPWDAIGEPLADGSGPRKEGRVVRYYRHPFIRGSRTRLAMAIVWRLPRWLCRWAYIRVAAHATTGDYSSTVVPELSMMDALQRWE